MRTTRLLQTPVAILGLLLACAVAPAHAGTDIDFGAVVSLDDDGDLYVAVAARYFDRDRDTIARWDARYRAPDDLTVAMFISRHSGKSLEEVHALRVRGLSWWEISLRFGVPVDAWFVPVERDPGPPYGKAYGYWKKHRADRRAEIVLTDDDLRNLVAVRMVHEYYGVSVDLALEWRASGSDMATIVAREYRQRHGRSNGHPSQQEAGRKKGHDKSKHGASHAP